MISYADHVAALNEYRQQHDGISERYFQQIRNDALQEAREAVEVLLKEWWEIFEGKPEDLKELKSMVELNRAIAAIDALKEEQ